MPKIKEKTIISLFTDNGRKIHTCLACESYKREIRKGNSEALTFYLKHIYYIAKKSNGNSFVVSNGRRIKENFTNTKVYTDLLALEGKTSSSRSKQAAAQHGKRY